MLSLICKCLSFFRIHLKFAFVASKALLIWNMFSKGFQFQFYFISGLFVCLLILKDHWEQFKAQRRALVLGTKLTKFSCAVLMISSPTSNSNLYLFYWAYCIVVMVDHVRTQLSHVCTQNAWTKKLSKNIVCSIRSVDISKSCLRVSRKGVGDPWSHFIWMWGFEGIW